MSSPLATDSRSARIIVTSAAPTSPPHQQRTSSPSSSMSRCRPSRAQVSSTSVTSGVAVIRQSGSPSVFVSCSGWRFAQASVASSSGRIQPSTVEGARAEAGVSGSRWPTSTPRRNSGPGGLSGLRSPFGNSPRLWPSVPTAAQRTSPSSGVRRAKPPVVLQTPSIGTSDPASTDHGNSASAWSGESCT